MVTYDYNRPSPKTIKSALTLRELADFDETGGNKDRVDNVQNNQVLVSLSQLDRPKTFSFQYVSDLLQGGTGISISTGKDGITTINSTGNNTTSNV